MRANSTRTYRNLFNYLCLMSICLLLVGALQASTVTPVAFEPNRGQTSAPVEFISRNSGYTAFLAPSKVMLNLRGAEKPIGLRFIDAMPGVVLEPLQAQARVSNYLIGPDTKNWRTGVPHYSRVRYRSVYPGIDVEFYGNDDNLEFDFIIAPGADPSQIKLGFDGTGKLTVNQQGALRKNLTMP